LPKGRLQPRVLEVFAGAGYEVPSPGDLETRRLVFVRGGIEWIFVKDSDVPVYVEHGAADAGIAGLDQILEHDCHAYQPVEMPFAPRRKRFATSSPASPRLVARSPRSRISAR